MRFISGAYTQKAPWVESDLLGEGISIIDLEDTKPADMKSHSIHISPNPTHLAVLPEKRAIISCEAFKTGDAGVFVLIGNDSSNSNSSDPEIPVILDSIKVKGEGSCHIAALESGEYAFTANYIGGSISIIKVHENKLHFISTYKFDYSSGANPQRQTESHPHMISILEDGANTFIYVPDLGADRLYQFSFDRASTALSPASKPFVQFPPGTGPRHMRICSQLKRAFVLAELTSEIYVCRVEPNGHISEPISSVKMLPSSFAGVNLAAAIHITSDLRFLYASNRGHDSIVCFSITSQGDLEYVSHTNVEGRCPREFTFDLSETRIFVANQDSNNIVLFHRDPITGKLSSTGSSWRFPAVCCILPW